MKSASTVDTTNSISTNSILSHLNFSKKNCLIGILSKGFSEAKMKCHVGWSRLLQGEWQRWDTNRCVPDRRTQPTANYGRRSLNYAQLAKRIANVSTEKTGVLANHLKIHSRFSICANQLHSFDFDPSMRDSAKHLPFKWLTTILHLQASANCCCRIKPTHSFLE